ncbi:MAG: FMN-dependent NADH-azoreductase [Hydrogenophilales bacterium 28-61-23]|nr:MAG: FMN-dependent NADH-azoreductase [Hydrogenophilales bacterium 28-61-23]
MQTPIQNTRVLRIDSSAQNEASVTRQLADLFIQRLGERQAIEVVRRDVAQGLPFVDGSWIAANFTDPVARDADKLAALALSDTLVRELQAADVLVIGVPIYNFGVPATLKAWIDLIARARLTFRYTEHGPEGLLSGKKAYLLVASGGTPVGGAIDFATPWLKHVLAFVGITEVEVIAAERLMIQAEAGRQQAVERIASVLEPASPVLAEAA